MGLSSISKCIKSLTEKGFIEVKLVKFKGQHHNEYTLLPSEGVVHLVDHPPSTIPAQAIENKDNNEGVVHLVDHPPSTTDKETTKLSKEATKIGQKIEGVVHQVDTNIKKLTTSNSNSSPSSKSHPLSHTLETDMVIDKDDVDWSDMKPSVSDKEVCYQEMIEEDEKFAAIIHRANGGFQTDLVEGCKTNEEYIDKLRETFCDCGKFKTDCLRKMDDIDFYWEGANGYDTQTEEAS